MKSQKSHKKIRKKTGTEPVRKQNTYIYIKGVRNEERRTEWRKKLGRI